MIATLSVPLESLGFALVHFIWQGALIAGLYKAVLVLRPKLKPQSQYALGLAALLAMAGAGALTLTFEYLRLGREAAPSLSGAAAGPAFDLTGCLPWLDALWLGGIAVLSVRTALGLRRIHRLAALARPVPEAIALRFAATVARLGLAHRVQLRLHPLIDGPFVVGLVRSVIYLPLSAVSALAPDQLDAIIAHELEHIRRADYAWNLVQTVVETLFFYHPLVWWIGARVREQRELCCDDAAVTACRDPLVYATALLSLARTRRTAPALAMALGYADAGPSLVLRMGRILGEAAPAPKPRRIAPGVWAPVALIAVLFGLALAVSGVAKRSTPATAPVPAQPISVKPISLKAVERPAAKKSVVKRHVHHAPPPATVSPAGPPPAAHPAGPVQIIYVFYRNMPKEVAETSNNPQVVGKEISGDKVTYLISGKPNGKDLSALFFKEHLLKLLPSPGSGLGNRVDVAALKPNDKDYPTSPSGPGDAAQRFKVVVTMTPTAFHVPAPPPASR